MFSASGEAVKFQALAHEVSMQIAASNPSALDRNSVDKEVIEKEKEIYRVQARNEGKPEPIVDKIAEGKLNAYFKEVCLLEQPFIKEPKISLTQHIDTVSKENSIKFEPKAFVRFALGGN
jgi:elongation factor Ts